MICKACYANWIRWKRCERSAIEAKRQHIDICSLLCRIAWEYIFRWCRSGGARSVQDGSHRKTYTDFSVFHARYICKHNSVDTRIIRMIIINFEPRTVVMCVCVWMLLFSISFWGASLPGWSIAQVNELEIGTQLYRSRVRVWVQWTMVR